MGGGARGGEERAGGGSNGDGAATAVAIRERQRKQRQGRCRLSGGTSGAAANVPSHLPRLHHAPTVGAAARVLQEGVGSAQIVQSLVVHRRRERSEKNRSVTTRVPKAGTRRAFGEVHADGERRGSLIPSDRANYKPYHRATRRRQ